MVSNDANYLKMTEITGGGQPTNQTDSTPTVWWLGGWWVWMKKTPFFLQLDLELWARIRESETPRNFDLALTIGLVVIKY